MKQGATPTGTADYARRIHDDSSAGEDYYRKLGRTGLTVSAVGFGGYRVRDGAAEHERALRSALLTGVNLIDTSSNYTDGGSERLVGRVLGKLFDEGSLKREEVVVVTKVGYAQGGNLELLQQAETKGEPFPDVVKYMDGCWHCIHPDFLEDQLQRSLDRLGLEKVDVYLLHNPEYFLTDAAKRSSGTLEERRTEYERRFALAFAWLEKQREAGLIGSYGISSNTFPSSADDEEHTSLERVLALAGDGLTTIQLPMNLMERGAWTERNQAVGSQSVLEVAEEAGLGVLVNRPLNAIQKGRLLRLASFGVEPSSSVDGLEDKLSQELEETIQIEDKLSRAILEGVSHPLTGRRLINQLMWAVTLKQQRASIPGIEAWNDIREHRIAPSLATAIHAVLSQPDVPAEVGNLANTYLEQMQSLLELVTADLARTANRRSQQILELLRELGTDAPEASTLSAESTWLLASSPAVSTVLVGMRKQRYVDDLKPLQTRARIDNATTVLEQLEETGALEKITG